MVYRVFVEKKKEYANDARDLLHNIREFLGIKSVKSLRLINRYDVENVSEKTFEEAKKTVFAEAQVDDVFDKLPDLDGAKSFVVKYLDGQFDQRSDSAMQCIRFISSEEDVLVKSAKVYAIYGEVSDEELARIKKFIINPVESEETGFEKPDSLLASYDLPSSVEIVDGFIDLSDENLADFVASYGLAMDVDDAVFCRDYFKSEGRNPSITEIKLIDTYWSDHCRHTTFSTIIEDISFEDDLVKATYEDYLHTREELGIKKPVCLMDMATISTKYLKKEGKLENLDESDEINACTVKIKVDVDGKTEDYLLLFKNETHNHPTEIEPFGGAATCIGGAIRDPLSGRAYVNAAMRITGSGDPTKSVEETMVGKLSQRKIAQTSAAGYSSYGNQIGVATGMVDEIYHDGFVAKHMELGAVIGSVPAKNVRREKPSAGDEIILLGGKTGRDGCGGATGSSKAHEESSIHTCGSEVQKGNAPEERKLQRLFRNAEFSRSIKKCNDFGAGGVSVAIGELADGLYINLDAVPKKYEGLDGTEIAISESQERMAVLVDKADVNKVIELARAENILATKVATVTDDERLVMEWNGKKIVDIKREFLNSNGAKKYVNVLVEEGEDFDKKITNCIEKECDESCEKRTVNKALASDLELEENIGKSNDKTVSSEVFPIDFKQAYMTLASDLNVCSKKGLSEIFDSTIGANTVLMPFGGKYQLSPIQAMVHKIALENGDTDDCSMMAYGYNPFISEKNQFAGAYLAVVESVSKLVATGAEFKDVYLTFQEYFERLGSDEKKWGRPVSSLLGAFKAQKDLGIAAIGGKDSMSGTFENISVPPTLISFAVTTDKLKSIHSPEFKKAGNNLYYIEPKYVDGLPEAKSLIEVFSKVRKLMDEGKCVSAYTLGYGGVAEAVLKMSLGNKLGCKYNDDFDMEKMFAYKYGAFVLELSEEVEGLEVLGVVSEDFELSYRNESIDMSEVLGAYEAKLEGVYKTRVSDEEPKTVEAFSYEADSYKSPAIRLAKPRVLIPVFAGTNCEYDTKKAILEAGGEAETFVINTLDKDSISRSIEGFARSVRTSNIVFLPGGFSAGDEPDGSGKFILNFFRNKEVRMALADLLDNRDGLMGGICNGFQALIKLGLVPFGKIVDSDENCPTLTYNSLALHRSKIVDTMIVSNKSPWFAAVNVGDIYKVPISHGEGRFIASDEMIRSLAENGQILSQYVDLDGHPSMDISHNPNGSMAAIEGITSPDGRIFGKMGHSERIGKGLYKNVLGSYDVMLFKSAVKYFA